MSTTLSIIILCEVIFALFIVWGFMHEELFVAFEDKIIFAVLRKIRSSRSSREALRREKLNEKVYYTPVKPTANKTSSRDTAA
ncbi:MAG: hypothetical protein IKL10_06345 [Clostridia bacterium]|nr:hypothetical protein [Clostridia bacterium]